MSDSGRVERALDDVVSAVEGAEHTIEVQVSALLAELEQQTRLLKDIDARLDSIDTELSLK